MKLRDLRPDPYILGILAAVAAAALLPVHGAAVAPFKLFTQVAVALLFFLYGARLSREAVVAGVGNWRLHVTALTVTFVAFPLVGVASSGLLDRLLASPLMLMGVLYLCCLPSTIQSSVALVSSARGDVAAAVCTASASNLVGVFASPLLVGLILQAQGAGVSIDAVRSIVLQLLVPFVAGQAMRRWIGPWTERHKRILGLYDRGTILLIVYGAFSAAVVAGVWRQVSLPDFAVVAAFCLVLLNLALIGLRKGARALGFPVKDEIVLTFCASQKGIAAGVPMAALIFPPAEAGLILLPVLIYHQFQLIGCAILAQRYAQRPPTLASDA